MGIGGRAILVSPEETKVELTVYPPPMNRKFFLS
jgi:hypothetical protein